MATLGLEIFNLQDGSERFTIKLSDFFATCAAFSPDSSMLLTGAGFTESSIRLWDAHSGKAIGTLEGHRAFGSDLLFTPDGKKLISSSADQTIRLWDWSTRQPAGILRGHVNEIDGLALAADGRTLASRCKDGSVYLWDTAKPTRHLGYQIIPGSWGSGPIQFMPDGRSILHARVPGGGEVAVWDAITLKETLRSWATSTNHDDGHVVSVSPDGGQVVRFDFHGHLRLWDARTGLETARSFADDQYFAADFSPDWKIFATARGDGTNLVAETWDTGTWQRRSSLITTREGAWDIDGTSQPNIFVIRNQRGLQFLDVTKPNEAPKQIPSVDFQDFALSPNGRIAAVVCEMDHTQLWDMATLQPRERLKGFLLGTHSVAFSPDGKRLAAGGNGQEAVKLWDTETWQEVLTLSGQGSVFERLMFSPDGRYLLAVSITGTIHLWSAPTWEEIKAADEAETTARK